MEPNTVLKAYAHYAPIYDHTFGLLLGREGRPTAAAIANGADWPAAAAEIATHGEVIEPGASASLELGERYERWCEIKSRLDAIAEEF